MNRRTTLALLFLVGALALGPVMIPVAAAYPTSCGAGGYTFQGWINVSTDGYYNYWESAGGAVYGTGRHSNNLNFRLYSSVGNYYGTPSGYGGLSDGDVVSSWWYVAIPAQEWQFAEIQAIFDKNNAPDPRCYAY